jgi:hypothetical protein
MDDNLFEKIVKNTGLPEELISQDFLKKISDKGFEKNSLTIDQIRDVLAEYLQDVILQAREDFK